MKLIKSIIKIIVLTFLFVCLLLGALVETIIKCLKNNYEEERNILG
jgi:hypothetical protein